MQPTYAAVTMSIMDMKRKIASVAVTSRKRCICQLAHAPPSISSACYFSNESDRKHNINRYLKFWYKILRQFGMCGELVILVSCYKTPVSDEFWQDLSSMIGNLRCLSMSERLRRRLVTMSWLDAMTVPMSMVRSVTTCRLYRGVK